MPAHANRCFHAFPQASNAFDVKAGYFSCCVNVGMVFFAFWIGVTVPASDFLAVCRSETCRIMSFIERL